MSTPKDSPLLAKLINGSLAGMIGVSCVFPLDLVKTRLQNQRIGPNGELLYANLLDCFKKIYRADGLRGFYRGVGIAVLLATPEKTIKLTTNDVLRHALTTSDGKLSYMRQVLAGGGAGLLQMLVSTPLDLMKINMQIASLRDKPGSKTTARSIFQGLVREKGILGIYRGIRPTACREVVFSATFFPLYAALVDWGPHNPDGSVPHWSSLLSGLLSGSYSAVFATPIDVVKTRIQASLKETDPKKICHGMINCATNIYKNEGIRAFYKGGFCRMMVVGPLLGIAQCVYFIGVGEKVINFFKSEN